MGTHISHSFGYTDTFEQILQFCIPLVSAHLLFVLYLVPSVVETQVALWDNDNIVCCHMGMYLGRILLVQEYNALRHRTGNRIFCIRLDGICLNSLSAYMKYAGAVVFVVINILQIMDIRVPMGSTLLVPTFFLLLLALLPHLNFKWLKTIGENSLGIYLFNMFIINILCALLPNNLITGVFIFIVSVCLSLFISICINKRMFLKRILFPSSIKDIKNCFNTK